MRIRRADDVAFEMVDGRAILVDPSGREVLTLNRVGTLVWQAIDEERDRSYVVESLASRFPGVPPGRIEADVDDFVGELRDLGLIAG